MCQMGDSFISLYGHLLPADRTKFIEGVLLEMIDISENETSREKLDVSIQREIGSILLDYERVGFKSLAMGAAELLGLGHKNGEQFVESIGKVTAEAEQSMANENTHSNAIVEIVPSEKP